MHPSCNQNDITYCENDWNDVINKYNLHRQVNITIQQEQLPETNDNHATPAWLLRTFFFTALITFIGNVPVHSKLIDSTPLATVQLAQSSDIIIDKPEMLFTEKQIEPLFSPITIASHELTLPKRALQTYAGHAINDKNDKWQTYHVKSYDNLTNIFHKIEQSSLLKILKADTSIYKELKNLKKGSIVRSSTNDGNLLELVLSHNNKDSFVIKPTGNTKQYASSWKQGLFEVRQSRSSFTVRNGLYFDGRKSGISTHIVKQIVKVFDWDIDFSHDVRVGDKVTAVFEEVFHNGEKVGVQNLLAAEFINKGKELRTIRYTNFDGKADYFTPQGREMKRAFIRTPIAHARISSHFNPGRFHPVLHKIKKHEGTDFAARTGTPIMASGNGTIISLGRKGGYGRTIIIKHREGYTTKYAHMSRYKKGLRVGKKVYQNDIIGYVGRSGRVTGPHLHYEFRKNGVAMNPMKVRLPNSMSLSRRELQDFRNNAVNLVLQLNVLHRFVKAKIEINSNVGG